jgi:hypothetical protein
MFSLIAVVVTLAAIGLNVTTADPLVSIGIAHVWLGETVASTPLNLAAEAAALAVMIGGIIALAHRLGPSRSPGRPPDQRGTVRRSTAASPGM